MKDEGHSPMDIANYIIVLANKNGKNITNLKLQKLLYYVNAKYLVDNNGQYLMGEKFQRWTYGPVMRSVYENFREFGSRPIDSPMGQYVFDPQHPFKATYEKYDENALPEQIKLTVKQVVDTLADRSAFELVRFTHNEELWIKYEEAINQRIVPAYENKEIYDYFRQNEDKQIWRNK